ncbi:MAG: hypothetical protein JW837_14930 [Sedimentisphaerales bacterium]|nr:hypothetical protein [Sedimentisphaerales bacterium]
MQGKANHIRPLLFALFILTMLCTAATGKVIYVDDDAMGEPDGLSWTRAYQALQDAISNAIYGDEIRVAKGTYKPDYKTIVTSTRGGARISLEASGDPNATFKLVNGVTFKGGYAGYGEPNPDARNISLYETILSGDLSDNDVDAVNIEDLPNEPSRVDNSYYVVNGSGTAVFDGFTITGGTNTGLIIEHGTIQIINCTFIKNSSRSQGGGIYNHGYPSLTNCTFIQNSTDNRGGGIYNYLSYPNLTDCTFIGNIAHYGGGGIYNFQSQPILTGCKFIQNVADNGGGMCNDGSYPVLIDCTFTGNTGNSYGGGIDNASDSYPVLNNCIFNGNSANEYGGGLSNNSSSSPTLFNCTFSANSAPNGNAIASNFQEQSELSTISLNNCILWDGDGGNEIWGTGRGGRSSENSIFIVSYSNIQGGWSGEGNIGDDPMFVNSLGPDNIPGTEDDDLRLTLISPCVDTGDPNSVPGSDETDLDGNPRLIKGRIDMGAYEFQGIIYVDDDDRPDNWQSARASLPLQDGTEQHPFIDIYEAVDAATDGMTILVKPGIYSRVDFQGKAITIKGIEGAAIIEGTLITQAGNRDGIIFHTHEGAASVLKNFIIRNSDTAISLNYGSKPTISNITIVDNNLGIAAYENSNPDISNCIFWNNVDGDLFQCQARYSCFENWTPGLGNMSGDPFFVDAANGDYHLKSEGWRWSTNSESWTDDKVTSRCIDAGDPDLPLGDEPMSVPRDPDNEFGFNRRINMGAFGGTAQASIPPIDWSIPEDLTPPEPNPPQWAPDGAPQEAYGGDGVFSYLARMTAMQATDNTGTVEYYFECTTNSDFSSDWQSSNTYSVTIGRSGQGHRFRFKVRDFYGNETDWSEELPAEIAPR